MKTVFSLYQDMGITFPILCAMDRTISHSIITDANGCPPEQWTTDEGNYFEASLPWLNEYINSLSAIDKGLFAPALEVGRIYNSTMAPHFPSGTMVGMVRVKASDALAPGLYIWQHADGSNTSQNVFGRLKENRKHQLILSLDATMELVVCPLNWDNEHFRLYRVACYIRYPCPPTIGEF